MNDVSLGASGFCVRTDAGWTALASGASLDPGDCIHAVMTLRVGDATQSVDDACIRDWMMLGVVEQRRGKPRVDGGVVEQRRGKPRVDGGVVEQRSGKSGLDRGLSNNGRASLDLIGGC